MGLKGDIFIPDLPDDDSLPITCTHNTRKMVSQIVISHIFV